MKYFSLLLMLSASLLFAAEPDVLTVGERFTIDSKVMGEQRTVLVHLPEGYERGQTRYPVLYLTDGDGHIKHTSGTVSFLARNGRMPDMIVVGVTNTNRTRDLTPTVAGEMGLSGGADTFLKFFTDELFAQIDKRYRTAPFKVFSGHSFGGLFAVNAFLTKPKAFNAFLSVSPSLWWDDGIMLKRAETFFAKQKELNTSFFMALGGEGERMEKPFDEMKEILGKQDVKGFRWDSKLMPDEDHGSVVLRAHYYGLKAIFDGWQAPRDVRGLDALVTHYDGLTKRLGYEIKPPEATVNMMGYGLMNDNKDEAIRVLTWNAKTYPGSSNVYDSLGEAFEKAGKLKQARSNFGKALKLGKANNSGNVPIYKQNLDRVTAALKKTTSGS